MPLSNNDQSVFKIALTIITLGIILSLSYFHEQLNDRWQFIIVIFLSVLVCVLLVCLAKKTSPVEAKSHPDVPDATPSLQKVLVVDDNPANRRFISEILKSLSITVVEASSGREAVACYQETDLSLIFMDIEMDDTNGIEATQQIRQLELNTKRTPVIGTSAHNTKEKKILALTSGFDDYLTKPIEEEQIKGIINRWVEQKNVEPINTGKPNKHEAPPEKVTNQEPTTESNLQKEALTKVVDIQQSLTYSRHNAELAKDMLSMLIELVDAEKDNIRSLYNTEKWQELGQIVHKISGGSCYCGVPNLQKHAATIDRLIDENKPLEVKQQFSLFEKALDDLLEWHQEHDLDVIFES